MPTYSYACTACEHRFDAVQAFTDSSLTDCPECCGRLRKLFSSVGIVFKGSGFYRTDSRAEATNGSGSGDKSPSGSGDQSSSGDKSGSSSESKSGAKPESGTKSESGSKPDSKSGSSSTSRSSASAVGSSSATSKPASAAAS